jgi:hypothetical protein
MLCRDTILSRGLVVSWCGYLLILFINSRDVPAGILDQLIGPITPDGYLRRLRVLARLFVNSL